MTQTREPTTQLQAKLVGGLLRRPTTLVNASFAELCETALRRGEGRLTDMGAFAAVTAPHTGRSPLDRFIVRDELTVDSVSWGPHNRPCSREGAAALRGDVLRHLKTRTLFVLDARAGAHPVHGIDLRLVTESAWHAMFARNMFLPPEGGGSTGESAFTILHAPSLQASPDRHGVRSETAIVTDLTRREIIVAGTMYAGEIKKSIFAVLNFLLPEAGALPMHCSANVGRGASGFDTDDVALFFGLSGTGKTTLSADRARGLIGDDEHGWAADGVFNFEGGCYAKTIDLSPANEPEIYHASRRFGTILENVALDEATRTADFYDRSMTENARASYPVSYIANAVEPSRAGHPRNVVFLTADAFGVLPPIARLAPAQAMYHFLAGYTAKVAGTERGVTEPSATFSACFGAPFMPRHSTVYARMLGDLLRKHGTEVWLVNTGWTGGGYGVGRRISIPHTRAMVAAALSGRLTGVGYRTDPVFRFAVPEAVAGVPGRLLRPRETWENRADYDETAVRLSRMFHDSFRRFRGRVPEEVAQAGPA